MKEEEVKEKGEIILRNHLRRCFTSVVKEFPDIKHKTKEEAIDYLLKLREERKIKITLRTVNNLVKTEIEWIS